MAATTFKPDFSVTLPDNLSDLSAKGLKLLYSLTARTIWDDTDLQFMFGDETTLTWDAEFASDYHTTFGGLPDAEFLASLKAVALDAFKVIDSVSILDFSETFIQSEADQVLVTNNRPNSGTEGFFEFPGTSFHDTGQTDSWSLGAFNGGLEQMTATPELAGDGEYANWTVLHEIGHSVGLKHTHQERRGLPPLSTVGKFMDNERYSVMSYNGSAKAFEYGHAVSFMALDIASLQALYGAEDYAITGSIYTLLDAGGGPLSIEEGDVDIGRAYYCIWDSGGKDQINYTDAESSVLINLNDATLDTNKPTGDLRALISQLKITAFFDHLSSKLQDEITDAWHHAGGFFSRVLATNGADYRGTSGGFSIAHGAEIEDANGGDKGDLLIGNEGDNTLYGFAGNDTMLGGSGADTLYGGDGNDRIDGGRGIDELYGEIGADRFVFSTGYGEDAIKDFEAGDHIDLTRLKGFTNFNDLRDNHMVDDDSNVVIQIGTDILTIEDISKEELTEADFLI
ncbi:M10 family metallopeptidase C-terminal domain-containing protein [Rhizobium sp. TH2]|uniref:M10 family metallopeptidase C-terminal domain-containing protein n=1 Tax=Rhizobium sp. TH2 TaxID=2775403 RepID=UPI00215759FC|nr:M10 family metallopeptidase C-terminal domain-containing protein [Rhizobium sp. TH2]UVC07125.1 M10 family metallopeptidase C-terminal domain-containing protein [Rhizobium sp. TH2]